MSLTMVTWWHPVDGYQRSAASREYQALFEAEAVPTNSPYHGAGWEEIDAPNDDVLELTIKLYEHHQTHDRFVDMWNVNERLAQVHVRAEHCDTFTMTEYLRIKQQADAINSAERERISHKALLAFIRHGHGKSTISESGDTREEMEARAQARFEQRQRKQTAKPKA